MFKAGQQSSFSLPSPLSLSSSHLHNLNSGEPPPPRLWSLAWSYRQTVWIQMWQKCTAKILYASLISKLYILIVSLHNYCLTTSVVTLTGERFGYAFVRNINPNIHSNIDTVCWLRTCDAKAKLYCVEYVIVPGFDRTKPRQLFCISLPTVMLAQPRNQPLSVFKSIQSIWLKHWGDLIAVFSVWRHHCTPDQWQITQLTPITNVSVSAVSVPYVGVSLIMTAMHYPPPPAILNALLFFAPINTAHSSTE